MTIERQNERQVETSERKSGRAVDRPNSKSSLKNFDNSICLPFGHEFVMANTVYATEDSIYISRCIHIWLSLCSGVSGTEMWRRFTLFSPILSLSLSRSRFKKKSKLFPCGNYVLLSKKVWNFVIVQSRHARALFIFYHCRTAFLWHEVNTTTHWTKPNGAYVCAYVRLDVCMFVLKIKQSD